MRVVSNGAWIAVVLTLLAAPAGAQQTQDTTELARIKRQVEAITRELEELRLGREVVAEADTSAVGLAPAASKVYRVRQGVAIGGYGEFLYQHFARHDENGAPSGLKDRIDAVRAILYAGYRFNDKWLFNSETEFEHAGKEVSVEFAYLEYRVRPSFGVRIGNLLAPMGFVNEVHEPPTFLGTTRPETERQIIPSTWHENGAGVFGTAHAFTYRAYLLNGFHGEGFGATGLAGGRQDGAEAQAENFGVVGRADYLGVLGLTIGGSAYVGNSGQGEDSPSIPGTTVGARTVIWEGHAEYRARGFDLRGLYAQATVDDAADLNQLAGLTGTASIGRKLHGWYLQAGYDLLRGTRSGQQLIPFVRYEELDTQDQVPAGYAADPANDRSILSLGAAWKPLANIAFKGDYQIWKNQAKTGVNQLNVNVGYLF